MNNRKGTNGFKTILCPQGINKWKRTALILGFLFVDSDQSDVNIPGSVESLIKVPMTSKFTLVFMIVFARRVKMKRNGFYSSLICSRVLELLRFM